MTVKHILLPLWVSTSHYGRRPFRFLINGQTGKVTGLKPKDRVKIILGLVMLAISVALGLWLIRWLWQTYGSNLF